MLKVITSVRASIVIAGKSPTARIGRPLSGVEELVGPQSGQSHCVASDTDAHAHIIYDDRKSNANEADRNSDSEQQFHAETPHDVLPDDTVGSIRQGIQVGERPNIVSHQRDICGRSSRYIVTQ